MLIIHMLSTPDVQEVRLTFCCQFLKKLTCILAIPFLLRDKLQGFLQVTPAFPLKWSLNPLTYFDKHSFKDPEFFTILQMIWSKTFLRTGGTNQPFQLFLKKKSNKMKHPAMGPAELILGMPARMS